MSVEIAYRQIVTEVAETGDINLILAATIGGTNVLERVNISRPLQENFSSVMRRATNSEVTEFIPYDPMFKLDDGQIAWLDITQVPDVAELVANVEDLERLALFTEDSDFLKSLKFHASSKRTASGNTLTFFRQMSPNRELERSKFFGALLSSGTFDAVTETLFLFDNVIDCFTDGRYMFVRNTKNFERIFGYLERLQACAAEVVDDFLGRIAVENADEFRVACTTQTRFMSKLASISGKSYISTLTMASIRKVIREHDLEIEVVGRRGHEKLIFDPSREKRWMLLKLLDDDFLNSVMTDLRYEVNSKQAR